MTKKQITIFAVILSIIVIAILAFYMTRTDDNINDETNTDTQEQEADLYDLEGDDSLDLIDLVLAEGEIDRETALVYKMYAIFGDEKLPSEYASEVMMLGANEAFIEIREEFGSLSPETQVLLSPYLKRPNDPESYFNLKYQESIDEENSNEIMSKIIPPARARTKINVNLYCDDCYLFAANSRVKIWYP
ncbi:hypothetical protein KAK05_02880, partial [Candidatus Parcubacteria bacterium]|nr:hypothetical protein [Candidatus Parcubacteria bacterium]